MTQNVTLKIDETGDLVIGEDGIMETLSGIDTTAQNIRMNLKTGTGDFPLVPSHGTDYEKIFKEDTELQDIAEEFRESIYQESAVTMVEDLTVTKDGRDMHVSFRAVTAAGDTLESEVML